MKAAALLVTVLLALTPVLPALTAAA